MIAHISPIGGYMSNESAPAVVVDTNVLVRGIVVGQVHEEKIISAIDNSQLRAFCTPQITKELWTVFSREVLNKRFPVTREHRKSLNRLLQQHFFQIDTGMFKQSHRVSLLPGYDYQDTKFIVAAAAYADLYNESCMLITNDYDLTAISTDLLGLGIITLSATDFYKQILQSTYWSG